MKVRIPAIVKDPEVSEYKEIRPTENILVEEDVFLDGPVSPRVAVLDFDPANGSLAPGVPFVPAAADKESKYAIPQPVQQGDRQVSREAAAVSVFAVVNKTLRMFEEPDALGRRISWAFGAPQLLVVPRAGEWANAYYERESRSLQLFFFKSDAGPVIYTSHSQDIVAHETAHAILDGIAPDLYGAITPQSLAIHEAVADVAALLCSLRCRELTTRVLALTGNRLDQSTAFSGIAEQFSSALSRNRPYLRNLFNNRSLKLDAAAADRVTRSEPHELSEVLSGALYRVLVRTYNEIRTEYERGAAPAHAVVAVDEAEYVEDRVRQRLETDQASTTVGNPAKALFVASERLKRTLLRGLDYLPPGDVTFADLARAVIASDEASHAESDQQRKWLIEEFINRGIVASSAALDVDTNFEHPAVTKLDLEALVGSDYAAYSFVNENRKLLGIPPDVTFEVRPRLDVTKLYWHREGKRTVRECLLKVAWSQVEDGAQFAGLPRSRRFTAGTTLAIGWAPKPRVRAILSSSRDAQQKADTDGMLRTMLDQDLLRIGDDALGPAGVPLRGVIPADVYAGSLRIRSVGRMLHVTREH